MAFLFVFFYLPGPCTNPAYRSKTSRQLRENLSSARPGRTSLSYFPFEKKSAADIQAVLLLDLIRERVTQLLPLFLRLQYPGRQLFAPLS